MAGGCAGTSEDEVNRPHQFPQLQSLLPFSQCRQDVASVSNTADLLAALEVERNTAVNEESLCMPRLSDRGFGIERKQDRARRHHIPHCLFAEREDVLDDDSFILVDGPGAQPQSRHDHQFLF